MKNIPISELHAHPRNPRLSPRQEVVDQIAGQLNGHMDEAHALIVRPNGSGFEIISGHHRKLAGEKAGLKELPCHVRPMSDEEAYMALVLNNAQSELLPIEIGRHQIGSGMTTRDYASRTGRPFQTLNNWARGAQVCLDVGTAWAGAFSGTPEAQMAALDQLHGRISESCLSHLVEIHAAPEWLWPALVGTLITEETESTRSVDSLRKAVKPLVDLELPNWLMPSASGIADQLVAETLMPSDIKKFSVAVANAEERIRAAKEQSDHFIEQMHIALGATYFTALSEVEAKCEEIIAFQASLVQERRAKEIEALKIQEADAEKIARLKKFCRVEDWKDLTPDQRMKVLNISSATTSFNKQEGDDIEWAQWSWNPITGCLHDCPYCYARDIANQARMAAVYPYGFEPVLHPPRLLAPQTMKVPKEAVTDHRYRNVFTGSMADIFGRWVPKEWIDAVLTQVRSNPQWTFLFLTKFPGRMAEFDFPDNAWVGTSVDCQLRIPAAEKAFAKVNANTKWLSVEPMIEPLQFKRLDLFQWVVIGGASKSSKTEEWKPPVDWVMDLVNQARAVGCKVYAKTNLLGSRAGLLELPWDAPIPQVGTKAPEAFNYLKNAQGHRAI